jgi:hypothetical protein
MSAPSTDQHVLLEAIRGGLRWLTWQQDALAYAQSYDKSADRYRSDFVPPNIWLSLQTMLVCLWAEAAKKANRAGDRGTVSQTKL